MISNCFSVAFPTINLPSFSSLAGGLLSILPGHSRVLSLILGEAELGWPGLEDLKEGSSGVILEAWMAGKQSVDRP